MNDAIGLSLATSSGLPVSRLAEIAGEAERSGFGTILLTERVGDVLAACPGALAATRTSTVGTGIANMYLHPPALTAMTAATLDAASNGRFLLGLGTANPALNQGMLGLPAVPPLQMAEEYIGAVRAVLGGEPFAGEVFGLDKPLPLDCPPERTGIPIYLAALQRRMLELAGRIADGVLLTLMSPEQVASAVQTVRRAARAAGRDPEGVTVAYVAQCCLSDDGEAALAASRRVVLRFAFHGPAGRLFAQHDPENRMAAVRESLDGGDVDAAANRVPRSVVDAFVAHGGADECRSSLERYREAGVQLPVVFPMPVDGGWDDAVETAISAFGVSGPVAGGLG